MYRTLIAIFLLFGLNVWSQNTYMKTIGTANSDYGTACIPTNDYGTLLLTSGGTTTGGGVQFGIVKTAFDGSLEWQKLYQLGNFSVASDVVATSDGYCLLGTTGGSFNSQELFVMKIDFAGNEIWNYHYDLSENESPIQLLVCQNGDLLSLSTANFNTGNYASAQLVRYDGDGNVLWSKAYSGFYGINPRAIVELSDGNFAFVSGVRLDTQTYPEHSLVTRTDAFGNVLWSKAFYSDYLEEPRDLAVNENDELFIVGQTYFIQREWDGFLMKLDGDGNRAYDVFFDAGTQQGEIFRRIALDNNGGALLLGDIGGFGDRNISLLRVNQSNGAIDWSNQYPLSPQFTNYPADLFVSYNDGIVFTGDVRPPTYFRDAALFRADDTGQIECYTAPMSYNTTNSVFSESDVTITTTEFENIARSNFNFTYPIGPITEKVICEKAVPVPLFSWNSEEDCPAVCLDFLNESLGGATSWSWEFEGANPSFSSDENPVDICYKSSGTFNVTLTVTNAAGTSTVNQLVDIPAIDCPLGEIPNVFTPNGDAVNDQFKFDGLSGDFNFSIVNRWGGVVFETSEPNIYWDGTTTNGSEASEGVYFYILIKNDQVKHGFLHLTR